jgi:MFS family permease
MEKMWTLDGSGLTRFLCRRTINGILAMRSFLDQFSTGFRDAKGQAAITPEQTSIIVSMLSAGTVLGALVSAPVGDYFGRRLSLIGAVAVFCFGVIFQVCADNIPLLLVGRCVGWSRPVM